MATAEMPKSRLQNTSYKPTADVTMRPTSVTLCTFRYLGERWDSGVCGLLLCHHSNDLSDFVLYRIQMAPSLRRP